jgi:two-component system alkaline phosphatase synthesis response regulator PhoP
MRARVLVVDDDADARLLLQTFLSLLGFEVRTAPNGRDALASARQFVPDIVFLDVWMPDMDGVETCLRLREGPCPRPVPIVAVTADAWHADELRCFDRVLLKPVDLDGLAELVTQRAAALQRAPRHLH